MAGEGGDPRTCSVTVRPIRCSFSLHPPSSISVATCASVIAPGVLAWKIDAASLCVLGSCAEM